MAKFIHVIHSVLMSNTHTIYNHQDTVQSMQSVSSKSGWASEIHVQSRVQWSMINVDRYNQEEVHDHDAAAYIK